MEKMLVVACKQRSSLPNKGILVLIWSMPLLILFFLFCFVLFYTYLCRLIFDSVSLYRFISFFFSFFLSIFTHLFSLRFSIDLCFCFSFSLCLSVNTHYVAKKTKKNKNKQTNKEVKQIYSKRCFQMSWFDFPKEN